MFGIERPDDGLQRLDHLQRIAARPQQQDHSRDRVLGERQIDEIHRPFRRVAILDGLRDADDLDRRAGAVIEPDAFADGIRARPVVFREAAH
mgnify:CR=1 FL=1